MRTAALILLLTATLLTAILLTPVLHAQVSAPVPAPPAKTDQNPDPKADPTADPAYASLTTAFDALRLRDYNTAIQFFRKAAALSPQRADIRKNLAYTLMKTGDNDSARDELSEARRIDPADYPVALDYAFLCFEAKVDAPARKAEARRIFAAVRDSGDPASRATAATAFHNIDEALRVNIERWQKALSTSAPTFGAHYELAQLEEQRDEPEQAAVNYTAAFRLQPERKSVLLELARVERARGHTDGVTAALLAASRGPEPRAAELACEQLPSRYPYVFEFREALELDPANTALHRELAYLLLSMSQSGQAARADAEKEFSVLVASYTDASPPEDYASVAQLGFLYLEDHRTELAMPLLNRVLAHGDAATANRVRMALHMPLVLEQRKGTSEPASANDQSALDPRVLGERSYAAGFLKDALRYFTQAHEANPDDASIALKLGWTNNMLNDDATAIKWFAIARQSDDPAIAAEAKRAWLNLEPGQQLIRTTVWVYPLFASRWNDLFGYGQVKTELRLKGLPLHPYASIRLDGDVRGTSGGLLPQGLSESAFITGGGVATNTWRGATAWFEAGIATEYLNGTHWHDYRGGLTYAHTRGAALGGERTGWFLETTADAVYISHFDEDFINYGQSRAGYTAAPGGVRSQFFWNQNFTVDVKRQYWANFMEMGPGFRFHPPGLPASVWLSASALHGVYLRNEGNPGRPNYNDFRVGIWYAFTK